MRLQKTIQELSINDVQPCNITFDIDLPSLLAVSLQSAKKKKYADTDRFGLLGSLTFFCLPPSALGLPVNKQNIRDQKH